jgi:hypothetical protein
VRLDDPATEVRRDTDQADFEQCRPLDAPPARTMIGRGATGRRRDRGGRVRAHEPKHVALLYAHDGSQPVGKWEELRQSGRTLIGKGAAVLLAAEGAARFTRC